MRNRRKKMDYIGVYKARLIAFSLVVLLFLSCEEDEKVIDQSKAKFRYLVSISEDYRRLAVYDADSGVVEEDVYYKANQERLPAEVTKIKEYGGNLYLFAPEAFKLIAINKFTFEKATEFDFAADSLIPSDICFPNSTDAYLGFENDEEVYLLDIYNYAVARKIPSGKYPVSLESAGNQIFTANVLDNKVAVIDSRTHNREALIDVAAAPSLVGVSSENDKAIIVSMGEGKIDGEQEKTAAKVTFINVADKTVSEAIELGSQITDAVEQIPIKLIVTLDDYAFVLTEDRLLRIDIIVEDRINTLFEESFDDVVYNKIRSRLILVKGNKIIAADSEDAGTIKEFILNHNITAVYPL